MTEDNLISQEEVDGLLTLGGFISEEGAEKSLIHEIKDAILDSGKLSFREWRSLRDRLREIEVLIPHIDLIIELKEKQGREVKTLTP